MKPGWHCWFLFHTILNVCISRGNWSLRDVSNFFYRLNRTTEQKSEWNPRTRSEWLRLPHAQNSSSPQMEAKLFEPCVLQGHSLELIMENHSDTLHSEPLIWACGSEYDCSNYQLPVVCSKPNKIETNKNDAMSDFKYTQRTVWISALYVVVFFFLLTCEVGHYKDHIFLFVSVPLQPLRARWWIVQFTNVR